jgi:hypothetical protein
MVALTDDVAVRDVWLGGARQNGDDLPALAGSETAC